MKEFIDETLDQEGTPINRFNMMAIQGFQSKRTYINSDGSVVEVNSQNEKLITVINSDGSITETFEGQKKLTKTTRFEDGTIVEEVI